MIEERIQYFLEQQQEAFPAAHAAQTQMPTQAQVEAAMLDPNIQPLLEDHSIDINVLEKTTQKKINKIF